MNIANSWQLLDSESQTSYRRVRPCRSSKLGRSKNSFDPDGLSQSLPGFIACRLDYLCPATDSEV
jgi:hypothetical protein